MELISRFLDHEPKKPSNIRAIDAKFFLHFLGCVAFIQSSFEDMMPYVARAEEVKPGIHTVYVERSYDITGIPIFDKVVISMEFSTFVEVIIGHEADFSQLICWGITNDNGPLIFAWWMIDMAIWKPSEEQKRLIPFRSYHV